jgi:hypothetical protein
MAVLLIIIPAWILILSVVVGLCVAARHGDRQEEERAPVGTALGEPLALGPAPVEAWKGRQPDGAHELVGAGGSVA